MGYDSSFTYEIGVQEKRKERTESIMGMKMAKQRNGEEQKTNTHHAAHAQEPNHNQHCLGQLGHVLPQLPVLAPERLDKLIRDVQVEDRRHPHGAEEADEDGLAHLLDLRDVLVDGEHPGEPAEEQDQDPQGHQAVDRDDVVGEELVPGAHGAVPHEDGHVQEHVDGGLERVVEGLEAEPVVPREGVAGDEAGEDTVFGWNATTSASLLSPKTTGNSCQ